MCFYTKLWVVLFKNSFWVNVKLRSEYHGASNFEKITQNQLHCRDTAPLTKHHWMNEHWLIHWTIKLLPRTGASVIWASDYRAGGREFDSGRTNTQGLQITEEKVLPRQVCHVKSSRLRTVNCRSRLTTFPVNQRYGTLNYPHIVCEE